MANLNKVMLIGNLTRDPELRYTPSGMAVVDFGLAINRGWTDKQSGEKKQETVFVDCQAWARSAEVISEYCRKGSSLFVEGRLRLDSWEGRDGQKRSRLRVVVENFQLLGQPIGRKAGAPAEGQPSARGQERSPAPEPEEPEPPSDVEPPEEPPKVNDDIPF